MAIVIGGNTSTPRRDNDDESSALLVAVSTTSRISTATTTTTIRATTTDRNTNKQQQQQQEQQQRNAFNIQYGSTSFFTDDVENGGRRKQQQQQQQQHRHYDDDDDDDDDDVDSDDDNNTNNNDCSSIISSSSSSSHNNNNASSAGKTIGVIGSIAIAVNSLAGPAVLQLPFQYQQSGIIPTTICLIGVAILSAFCSLHMANTVSKMPNNRHFDQCVEFSDPFRTFWNDAAYKVTHVLFFLTATCLNVAAIVDTAEVVDSFFGLHYASYAISFDGAGGGGNNIHGIIGNNNNYTYTNINTTTTIGYANSTGSSSGRLFEVPKIKSWYHAGGHCTSKEVKLGQCDPYADIDEYGSLLLTAGYIVTTLVFLPICLKDLKENTVWQVFGFGLLLSLSAYFCASFVSVTSLKSVMEFKHVTLWGDTYSDMLGVIMFNFALVLAIPAWLNEKKAKVSVHATVVQSTCLATSIYIAVGILGAFAIPHVNVNMLSPMVSGAYGSGIQFASSVFAFFIIGLDIPLFSVLTRYNLTHSGLCSDRTANIFVVWIPWCISWVFYQGDSIGILLSWGGVILTSAIAFILPLYISLRALRRENSNDNKVSGSLNVYGVNLTKRQQITSLYILLIIAIGAVGMAIIGQIMASDAKERYLDSSEYINGAAEHVVHQSMNQVERGIDNLKALHANTIITLSGYDMIKANNSIVTNSSIRSDSLADSIIMNATTLADHIGA